MFSQDHDKQFLQTILGSIADGVFTVDKDWRITSFNSAAERITGVAAAEAMGRHCSEVFHADICERNCALRQTLESGDEQIDVPAKRTCEHCGELFHPKRSTARYCCDKCRVCAHREKQRESRAER